MSLTKKLAITALILGGLIIQACANKQAQPATNIKFANPNLSNQSINAYTKFFGSVANSSLSDGNNPINSQITSIYGWLPGQSPTGSSIEVEAVLGGAVLGGNSFSQTSVVDFMFNNMASGSVIQAQSTNTGWQAFAGCASSDCGEIYVLIVNGTNQVAVTLDWTTPAGSGPMYLFKESSSGRHFDVSLAQPGTFAP